MFCALDCSPTKNLYRFPNQTRDRKRRKVWLNFFDLEEPNTDNIFACGRHFSRFQSTVEGIRPDAVPDIPISCVGTAQPFKRKQKNWRKNVVVVTSRDPEFTIYRHETGVFPQTLFNIPDIVYPVIEVPKIKSVSCSMSTQTNTRMCGLVQISDIKEEYRINCFYCNEIFGIAQWSKFVSHIKSKHFEMEDAFKMSKYLDQDHDYAFRSSPPESLVKSSINFNMFGHAFIQAVHSTTLPTLLAKPQTYNGKSSEIVSETIDPLPPPLLANPHQSNDKLFNISLADQLVKLLNETVLSPRFLNTEEDNILIIKNSGSDNIETSNFLENLINPDTICNPSSPMSKKPNSSNASTRPIYTISHGKKDIPSNRHSLSRVLLPPLPKNKMAKLIQKRIAQQTLKNINVFEKVYKTVKIRHPKVVDQENTLSTDDKNNKQISNLTPLNRCLKRKISETMPKKSKAMEIVFEYTPENIIVSLLENMKKFPVLWEFHDEPFNKEYLKAIEKICLLINEKWSLNITLLKMRRSINRILRFYQFMLPCESIDKFEEYFDKCALFLPSSAEAIPRSRCVYCSICFKKDSELRKHIKDKHKSLKWPYKCQKCFERFREIDEYELHKRLPHYEEIFKCQRCDKRFNRRHLLNKHVGSHKRAIERRFQAATHVCDVCNKQFRSMNDLNHHKIYHGEKKFKCHLCPKAFSLKMTLKLHLKRHRKELDFMCEVCGKGFIRKAYLNDHMDTHTGAKVTCNICNLKLRKNNLLRHLRLVHVATEGSLESTFRAKSHHYKKYLFPTQTPKIKRTGEKLPRQYDCKICKLPFSRLKVLKDHNKQAHADVKRTPCRICNVEFLYIQNLKRHYRDKHKLHTYQIFKLVYQNESLNTVMAMNIKDLDNLFEFNSTIPPQNNKSSEEEKNLEKDSNFYQIQDEIMKAVESLDKQEIKVDDERSMNDFFADLLKHS